MDHAAFTAELDARVEHQILRYADPANKRSLGELYDSVLQTELAPFLATDGAADLQLPTVSVRTAAGCHDELKAAIAKAEGHPRGTWLLIERFYEADGARHSSWLGVMSTGGPTPHQRQALPEKPGYAEIRKSMLSRETYDSRHRVNARRQAEREDALKGKWPVGTVLKGLRSRGATYSSALVEAIDQHGRISLRLTKPGSPKRYTTTATHLQVQAMLDEHAEMAALRSACRSA